MMSALSSLPRSSSRWVTYTCRTIGHTRYTQLREGDPGRGGLQGARPRAWQLGGPASRGLAQ
eukprot:1177172-Prorocentrum_minimum.AAC.2